MKTFDNHIQTLRGFAIILILFLHLSVENEFDSIRGGLDFLSYVFTNVRIPLFTVISGYFYTFLALDQIGQRTFFTKKATRLLIPLYFAISAEFLIQLLFFSESTLPFYLQVVNALFFANGHY
ncbi:acyltransferase family protein [Alteromonas sp. MYP5]|uniref:Acyltransferase family protein n=1 Tax=Alteromonas ponticola TaxID=2720613 RepID=A0ABX1R0V5_9ALTE|nr:acyltransferase family protein [Alteromonas ponticola]